MREVRATGEEALRLATELLQRARRADANLGLWEAADVQWWSRTARPSDDVEKPFWVDDQGPVAGVLLTSWSDGNWQCDPVVVPGAPGADRVNLWERAVELGAQHSTAGFKIAVDDEDRLYRQLAESAGLIAVDHDRTAWLNTADRAPTVAMPEGFELVDRTERQGAAHPMQQRNGAQVAERLAQCSLYDPALDLSVESADGHVAGYSLYWYDQATGVGLVEPVRVADEFHRRGLARAMLSEGIDRLLERGARRVKVSFATEVAAALYEGLGFRPTSSTSWYSA